MERVTNYLRGSVRIRVRCRYPERFINICAKSGVEFWDMEREGEDLVLTTHRRDYRFLRRRALMGDYDVTEAKTAGTVFFLRRFRRRYALLAGMLLTLCALWYASLFIWEIGVTGNETVPSAEILRELKELGVGVGTLRLTLDQDRISNEMLLRIPELCWLTVNTNGCRAEVKVREEIPKPEMVDEYVPTEVYAKKTGIIEKMTILEGKKLVMPGDTVMAGDILVTGAMDSLSTGTRYVHAMGDIYARTLYSVSAAAPSAVNVKDYTGREKTKHALVIGGSRLNLYFSGGVSWEHYDKTAETRKLEFFGFVLPAGLAKDTYREYELSVTEAEDIPEAVKERMLRDLAEIIDGEVRKTEFSVDERDGRITVTMTAECLEQIGALRKLAPEDMTDDKAAEGETGQ